MNLETIHKKSFLILKIYCYIVTRNHSGELVRFEKFIAFEDWNKKYKKEFLRKLAFRMIEQWAIGTHSVHPSKKGGLNLVPNLQKRGEFDRTSVFRGSLGKRG